MNGKKQALKGLAFRLIFLLENTANLSYPPLKVDKPIYRTFKMWLRFVTFYAGRMALERREIALRW